MRRRWQGTTAIVVVVVGVGLLVLLAGSVPARLLGIGERTLYRKIMDYGL